MAAGKGKKADLPRTDRWYSTAKIGLMMHWGTQTHYIHLLTPPTSTSWRK